MNSSTFQAPIDVSIAHLPDLKKVTNKIILSAVRTVHGLPLRGRLSTELGLKFLSRSNDCACSSS